MKPQITNFVAMAVLAFVSLAGTGCGGGATSTPQPGSAGFAPLVISSSQPPDGVAQSAYNGGGFTMTAMGGKPSYTWTWSAVTGSVLPPGLNFTSNPDGTATISGSPSVLGSYDVLVQVTDSQVPPATTNLSYTINVTGPQVLAISSSSPVAGTVGQSYGGTHAVFGHAVHGFILSASGGVPGYNWTWAAAPGSSLPPGLNLQVLIFGGSVRCCAAVPVIDGTPSAAGSYDVSVTVTDSDSPPSQASANYTIVIN